MSRHNQPQGEYVKVVDTVSEAIEKEKEIVVFLSPCCERKMYIGADNRMYCWGCSKYVSINAANKHLGEKMKSALHRIATLSYARGVEDSAMVIDSYRGKGAFDLRSIAAAIRKLTPNEKKV